MPASMTSKERWLAALRLQPVDRLPFWPKLGGNYPGTQAAPFRAMALDALHAWIGSDPHGWVGPGVREKRSHTAVRTEAASGRRRTLYETPLGACELLEEFDAPSDSWHPMRFPVQCREDIGRMTAWYDDAAIELDPDGIERARAECARLGAGIGESPLMHWVEWLAGVEHAHYLLADYPGEVEALFAAMHRVLLRRAELMAAHNPADVCYMVENTSTTLISPEQYDRYCFRHLGEYGRITRAAQRILVLHMCGHLKRLLPRLAQLPVEAFEAFTSPTLGNTSLLDGRTACPGQCLIGGTNAMLWTFPAAEIIRQIERDLDELPHHRGIVVTSAGVMPPRCAPETIRTVCEWVRRYPVRN